MGGLNIPKMNRKDFFRKAGIGLLTFAGFTSLASNLKNSGLKISSGGTLSGPATDSFWHIRKLMALWAHPSWKYEFGIHGMRKPDEIVYSVYLTTDGHRMYWEKWYKDANDHTRQFDEKAQEQLFNRLLAHISDHNPILRKYPLTEDEVFRKI